MITRVLANPLTSHNPESAAALLGLLIGAQVKTGDSFFDEPEHDESGAVTGWWFRDNDREHIDYWLGHTLPHLVVLHRPDTGISYWAHVTAESVVSTGRGGKVLVPRANTVDRDHLDALLEVAATARPPSMWEGSAWTGAGNLVPADRLRHALVVPRLVAPHRNAGFEQATKPEQVVALLVQARLADIEEFARRHPGDVPTLDAAGDSPDWLWRFVGALGERITTGAVQRFIPLIQDAPNPPARAAAVVVAAAALLEQARPDEALDVLQRTLDGNDGHTPVDHAWLLMQYARACVEVGRIEEARSSAVQVYQLRLTSGNDVTATAIAGTAAMLLFTTGDWGVQDVEDAITGLDTTAVWWRYQYVAGGAGDAIEREFTTWTRRSATVTFRRGDTANNQLFGAAIMASHLGDHGGWRRLASLNARQALLTTGRVSEPDRVCRLLTALRTAGDDSALDLAVQRLVPDGPAAAVTAAAAQIDPTHWTHTISRANLILLRRGGDVLDEATASAATSWLLATLVDGEAFRSRATPTFAVDIRLVDTLAGVAPAAPPADRLAIAEFILALPGQQDQAIATSWARVVYALPADTWTRDLASRAATTAGAHHDTLQLALLAVAVPVNEDARQQVLSRIRDHSLTALAALDDLTTLPDDVVTELITRMEQMVADRITSAKSGSWGLGGFDVGRALAVLNVTYPSLARWDAVYGLLEEPLVAARDKRTVCIALAAWADRLSIDVQERLSAITSAMLTYPTPLIDQLDGSPSATGPVAQLAVSLSTDVGAIQSLLVRLLTGDTEERAWAARLAIRLDPAVAAGVLTPLAQDPEHVVRATAASCLARLVADGEDGLAAASLHRCVEDPGALVPTSVAAELATRPTLSATANYVLQQLASHRSASVRAAVVVTLTHQPDQ